MLKHFVVVISKFDFKGNKEEINQSISKGVCYYYKFLLKFREPGNQEFFKQYLKIVKGLKTMQVKLLET